MKFYRYEVYRYEYGVVKLHEMVFSLVRETPGGWWITDHSSLSFIDKPKWVSKYARKRFAYPTQKEALDSFIARKRRQVSILSEQLSDAEAALLAGEVERHRREQNGSAETS